MRNSTTIQRYAELGADYRFWYRHANEQLKLAASELGCTEKRLADLLALFSPRVQVRRSIDMAIAYQRTREFPRSAMVAVRAAVNHYEATGIIRGQKTGPFSLALQGDYSAVVLDVWMSVAFGIDQRHFVRQSVFRQCCDTIRRVADRLQWYAAECQAAVWSAIVGEAGRKVTQFNIVNRLHMSRNQLLF